MPRARVDGIVYSLDEWPELDKSYKHRIEVVADRLVVDEDNRGRLSQSVESALDLTDGRVVIVDVDKRQEQGFSLLYACLNHPEVNIPELEPRTFSFNSPFWSLPNLYRAR